MLTKDVTAELQTILDHLHAEGKEPSIALVKAHLSSKVPIPALIAAIKQWKAARKLPKVEVAQQAQSETQQVAELTKQVDILTKRLNELEARLHQLEQNQ